MKLFQLRTWHRFCAVAFLGLLAVPISWFLPWDSPFQFVAALLLGLLACACVLGAFQGILLAMGKLAFGCPHCGRTAPVTATGRGYLMLTCPECGTLVVSTGLGRLRIRKLEPTE
jgi:predicted RNA-binding Zn-ribbon protein involved in translation (DUF1610 family)